MDKYAQVQCEECLCTLYFTDGSYWGITGELCDTCQEKKEAEKEQEELDYWD